VSVPLGCECSGWGWWRYSDEGGEVSVDTADDTAEIGGKELEERCDDGSGADTDAGGGIVTRDVSLPRGEGAVGGDVLALCMERACVSRAEARAERGERGEGSAVDRNSK